MKVREVSACPGCGNLGWSSMEFGVTQLRKCTACELVFAPAYAEPGEIYIDGYLTGATKFGPGNILDPYFQAYLANAADRRMRILHAVVPPPGSLLDVGCGTGEFLAAARERGWTVTGCDPVLESARHATRERGLDVRATLLEDSGLPERSFDVVTATHVLEHMHDPAAFVALVARWVRPGGHLFIEVPNFDSFHRRGHGEAWPGLCPLEHVVHFTPRTLRALINGAGFRVRSIRTPCFLWRQQSLRQVAYDLGRMRLYSLLSPGARRVKQGDSTVLYPRAPAWWALRGVEWVYDRLHRGTVVVAIARVP
jgi:2-polyprenyl-3-methyl-5-hydroxy-6-metoxy-1,4-benzoquinol methylase